MIARDLIQSMFDDSRSRASFDIDGVCVWGFFFTDTDRAKLAAAGEALANLGYRVVGVLEPSPENDDQATHYLHVERTERHTVDSLMERNAALDQLAESLGLQGYDGMDVGGVDFSPPDSPS